MNMVSLADESFQMPYFASMVTYYFMIKYIILNLGSETWTALAMNAEGIEEKGIGFLLGVTEIWSLVILDFTIIFLIVIFLDKLNAMLGLVRARCPYGNMK